MASQNNRKHLPREIIDMIIELVQTELREKQTLLDTAERRLEFWFERDIADQLESTFDHEAAWYGYREMHLAHCDGCDDDFHDEDSHYVPDPPGKNPQEESNRISQAIPGWKADVATLKETLCNLRGL